MIGRARAAVILTWVVSMLSVALAVPAAGIAGFGDVEGDRYFSVPVQWMVDEEITTGVSATCFAPGDPVTRGQAAAFLWRMEDEPAAPPHPFVDIERDWQQAPISWLHAAGITTGTSPDTYSPDDTLTRGQFAALLHRLAGEPAASNDHPFVDVVLEWQQAPVSWMFEQGITVGTSDTEFSPDGSMTRGQIATFLYRYRESPPVTVNPASPRCGDGAAGLNVLFMGDSFFAPAAEEVDDFALAAGLAAHQQLVVFSGGGSGAPQGLWEQPALRAEIQSVLDTGMIDVLGMIYHRDHQSLEGYRNWIGHALEANPETAFFVALSWLGEPESYSATDYGFATWLSYNLVLVPLIDDLRDEFPEATIFGIPYGLAAVELRTRFEAGELTDVSAVVGGGGDAIFYDTRGHADHILEDLTALLWLGLIYDIDLTSFESGDGWSTDLEAIAAGIISELDREYTSPN